MHSIPYVEIRFVLVIDIQLAGGSAAYYWDWGRICYVPGRWRSRFFGDTKVYGGATRLFDLWFADVFLLQSFVNL